MKKNARLSGDYHPASWELGRVREVKGDVAKVVPCDHSGRDTGKSVVFISARNHRWIQIGTAGLSFSKDVRAEAEHGVMVCKWIVFERRVDDEQIAFGWAHRDDYRTALDTFDEQRRSHHRIQQVEATKPGTAPAEPGVLDTLVNLIDQPPVEGESPQVVQFRRRYGNWRPPVRQRIAS